MFRVVKFQGKGVTGYLECQVCGYLSPGFEKYLQKAHFHEEHPLENEVNCSKYMNKIKTGAEAFNNSQQAFKVVITSPPRILGILGLKVVESLFVISKKIFWS